MEIKLNCISPQQYSIQQPERLIKLPVFGQPNIHPTPLLMTNSCTSKGRLVIEKIKIEVEANRVTFGSCVNELKEGDYCEGKCH